MRPYEVAELIRVVPGRMLPSGHTLVASVSAWLQSSFRDGSLAYMPDVEGYGLDQWCSPAATLERGGGDCDDLSILATSVLLAGGVDAYVVVGSYLRRRGPVGHAWVEGADELGGFLLESTSGHVSRSVRPAAYQPEMFLRDDMLLRVA